ncbi:hypothetical protein NC651_026922 [Populus alba x Populus x berolinensis]|nr:hypothetical protein NC651_026922 [Populus alba x Populus x berolinensis]
MNPSLEMLVGGIKSVTLWDEESNRRGVQKIVMERKGPSTFSYGVEIISKTELRVHRSLEATVSFPICGSLQDDLSGSRRNCRKGTCLETYAEKKDDVLVEDFHLTDERIVTMSSLLSLIWTWEIILWNMKYCFAFISIGVKNTGYGTHIKSSYSRSWRQA